MVVVILVVKMVCMSNNKPWIHPPYDPDYYQWLRDKKVNKPLRLVASTAGSIVCQVLHGRLITEVPETTRHYKGRAVFSPVHRSGWDIPTTVAAVAKAGFERPRPVSRHQNYPNRPVSWFMHSLGAGAVDRDNAKLKGIELAFGEFLENNETVEVFSEGTRIRSEARRVHDIAGTAIMLAAQHEGTAVIGIGMAGLADEDVKRPIGFGIPTVVTFAEPLEVPYANGSRRGAFATARKLTPVLFDVMQAAQDRAYQIRDACI